ncbi:hypothetical protein BH23PLA1_BH23PLA1_12580 [soil metagenome]
MVYAALGVGVLNNAIVAAVLGFGNIAETATGIGKILVFVCIVLFLVSLLTGLFRKPPA